MKKKGKKLDEKDYDKILYNPKFYNGNI